ncbi:MAG TPA: hypothetical protein VE988_28010 [Gemmataceae bacterium]|nr:hypothetical protein [Gemmataceae bacterium]
MNPLQSRLSALRRRLRFVVTVRGACLALAALLTGLLLAGVVDYLVFHVFRVETWPLLRAGFLAATLALSGAVAYLLLIRPLAAKTDDLSLALRVEEQYPILNDSLASTVQFLESQSPLQEGTSASLQKEAVQRALRLAQGCDFNKAVNARGLSLSAAVFVAILAVVLPLLFFKPALALTALTRTLDPFGEHPWVGKQTELTVHHPAFLAIGQPLTITGTVSGVIPAKAEIEFDDTGMPPRQVDIKAGEPGHGSFVAAGIKPQSLRREIRFRVRANDAVSPPEKDGWHKVELKPPPQLASLNGKPSPQIVIRQPRYTELPEFVTLPPGTGNIDLPAGSHVTLRAATDVPIVRAWIEFNPLLPAAKESLMLSGFGARHPVEGASANVLANGVWGRVPAALDPSGKEFTLRFLPALTGAYVLTIQDKDGLTSSYPFDLHVRPDPVPVVSMVRPSMSQSVLANAEITLQILAEDEIYALRNVYLEYRRKDKRGQWVDSEPKRLYFYDHAKAEIGLPQLLTLFAARPFPVPIPTKSLHLRPKQLLVTQRWSLRGLAVEGETLVIQACAEDFNDIAAFPQPGRSHEIELKVVGKAALAAVIDEQEAQIQQQLLKLREMQNKAITKVIGAEEQWRAAGKLRPEDVVELAEAEQIQKEIQGRIGAKKDEGLRGELNQLEELLKDNKLPKSDVTERIRAIREELDRISRENLPKIEPAIAKARRELESPEQPKMPAPMEPGDLGDARAQQDKVYQALDEMLKFMEEQSTFQQLKGELRAILNEQQEREKEVEKLEEAVKGSGENVLRNNPFKSELRRTAELQRRLGDRAQGLLDKLEQLAEKFAEKDAGLQEMLERAAKIGKENLLPASMRGVAELLRDEFDLPAPPKKSNVKRKYPNVHLAHKTQDDVIAVLEKMLDALDQARADEIERLIVRQKKEEKNVDELAAKMAKLQANIEMARKIGDPKEREAALKKLGQELRDLQKATEAAAREMARAQAKDAANDLKDAAKKMERVLRELDRGEDPDEALRQAQEKLDSARDNLKDAREMAEQELSREQIAKIVDRLKGLKERQDASLAESERLRKDFLQNQKWMVEKLRSLIDLQDSQKAVAGETSLLRDKLKGAKVFHTILDRSAQDMTDAAAKIDKWNLKASQHQAPKILTPEDFTEEKLFYETTVKYQKSAGDRLQRLIDALLPELEPPPQDPKQDVPKDGGGGKGENPKQQGGIQAQDGIPPVAQLKALKAEQLDVNARTKEFAELHPNFENLTEEQHGELEAIRAEQDRLLQLFRELITAAKVEGGKR